jgi:hypothetical protein
VQNIDKKRHRMIGWEPEMHRHGLQDRASLGLSGAGLVAAIELSNICTLTPFSILLTPFSPCFKSGVQKRCRFSGWINQGGRVPFELEPTAWVAGSGEWSELRDFFHAHS